jgi:hypothetical protein
MNAIKIRETVWCAKMDIGVISVNIRVLEAVKRNVQDPQVSVAHVHKVITVLTVILHALIIA